MNNNQFRKLVLANSEKSPDAENEPSPKADRRSGSGSLGSRERANIPMTPRSLSGAQGEFARQLAQRNQAAQPQKNFKGFVPKGVKLATGYTDRTKERLDETSDDRAQRLAALEKSRHKGEVDKETYDKLRFEIAGGSLETTHLVKGLDFKLLERIRRGEDVYGNKKKDDAKDDVKDDAKDGEPDEDDVDDAFDELEQKEVQAIERDRTEKKAGQLAAFPVVPGKKRTRDQILAELRASREAAKAQRVSSLGSKFKKIGTRPKPGTRMERDSKGRQVLIIVDEDGHEKRKVRKLKEWEEEEEEEAESDLLMPDPKVKPLGMEVPEQYRHQAEPEEDLDDDIFGGVGDDYDPLAGMDAPDSGTDSDSSQREDGGVEASGEAANESDKAGRSDAEMMPPPPKVTRPAAPHNYFKDSKTGLLSAEVAEKPSMEDPAIMAAIKRAAAIGRVEDDDGEGEGGEGARGAESMEGRRRRLLRMSERDDADMDMGFGTSRLEDEEDGDEQRVKLSVWGGGEDGGEGGSRGGGQGKRKRGPKKRKGDANSAADVLRVMEQRKRKP